MTVYGSEKVYLQELISTSDSLEFIQEYKYTICRRQIRLGLHTIVYGGKLISLDT